MVEKLLNRRLLVISHTYCNFEKTQIELLAPFFKEITVLVRYKPISELYRIVNIPGLKTHSKKNAINLDNLPHNVKVFPTPLNYLPLKSSYKKLGNKQFLNVAKQIEKENIKFDFILGHFLWTSGFVVNLLSKKYNKPAFVIVHENHIRLQSHLRFSETKNWDISSVFSVNIKNIDELSKTFKKVYYLPNTYNDDIFVPMEKTTSRKNLSLSLDNQIFLNVANYTIKDKNQLNLIDAFKKYNNTINLKAILYLIGNDAGDKSKIEDYIKKLKMEDYIKVIGAIKNNLLPQWMNASDFFVFPSNNESFGVAQVEALACGTPVIATRNGGSEEIILNDDIGILSEGKDSNSLYDSLVKANSKEWKKEKIIASTKPFRKKAYSLEIINKIKLSLNENN